MSPERWHPDLMLVPAVLAGRTIHMHDLSDPDRCWLVAGLTLHGLTAEETADRLGCSLRTVRKVRAEPATILAAYVQAETRTFDSEMRLARSEQLRLEAELARTDGELERVRHRLQRATSRREMCFRGLHELTPYNTYTANGRRRCRACHREWMADWRAARKAAGRVRLDEKSPAPA